MVFLSFIMLYKFPVSFFSTPITIKNKTKQNKTLYQAGYLPPFHLLIFLEKFLVLLFGAFFKFPLFCLPFCICFCVLDGSAMSPNLGRVTLCSRWLVGSNNSVSLITWTVCLKNVPFVGYVSSLEGCWHVCMWGWSSVWIAVIIGHKQCMNCWV